MSDYYTLDARGEPIPCPALLRWAHWYENSWPARKVAITRIGLLSVHTVFLGLDHAWGGGPPILWETMVFNGNYRDEQGCDRCSGSREQAEAMHALMVEQVRGYGWQHDPALNHTRAVWLWSAAHWATLSQFWRETGERVEKLASMRRGHERRIRAKGKA